MLNRVELIGRIGEAPVISTTTTGKKIARFAVACSQTWKDKVTGEKKEHTDWINCVVWTNTANFIERYVQKGDLVYVCGAFQTREYEKDGHKNYMSEVVLSSLDSKFEILKSKNQTQEQVAEVTQKEPVDNDYLNDDIPFN